MKAVTLFVLALMASTGYAADPPKNARLAAMMKAIAADFGVVAEPAKKPAETITDDMVLAGMVRARSAAALLQLLEERKGAVVDGAFVAGELTPDPILGQPADKAQELLTALTKFVTDGRATLAMADMQLSTEYSKQSKDRNFTALKRTVAAMSKIIGDAHALFRPKPPPRP